MKKKIKLNLDKEVIASLSGNEMNEIRGGAGSNPIQGCIFYPEPPETMFGSACICLPRSILNATCYDCHIATGDTPCISKYCEGEISERATFNC